MLTERWSRLRNEIRALHFVLPTDTDVTLKSSTGTPFTFHVSFQSTFELPAATAGAADTASATVIATTVAKTESPRRDDIDTTTLILANCAWQAVETQQRLEPGVRPDEPRRAGRAPGRGGA